MSTKSATVATGPVVSSMVKVAVVLLLFPQSSVAVKITVAAPAAPQSSLKESKSLLHDTSLHASEAVAPPWLVNQASSSAALPEPSHSTVASLASVKVGAVLSSMVKMAVVLVLLPQLSVAENVTVAEPVSPQSSLKPEKSWLHVTSLQPSEASAPPLSASQASRSALFPAPSHSTKASAASTSMVGAVKSSTEIVCSHDASEVFPQWSLTETENVRVKL